MFWHCIYYLNSDSDLCNLSTNRCNHMIFSMYASNICRSLKPILPLLPYMPLVEEVGVSECEESLLHFV